MCVCVACVVLLAVKEISDLLNTGLDSQSLEICVQLIEAGVNPEALAAVVKELRRETAALKVRVERNVWEGGDCIIIPLLMKEYCG